MAGVASYYASRCMTRCRQSRSIWGAVVQGAVGSARRGRRRKSAVEFLNDKCVEQCGICLPLAETHDLADEESGDG
jgi:hypothetical protein